MLTSLLSVETCLKMCGLEAFADAIIAESQGKDYIGPWVSLDESVKLMELIDDVYRKAKLPVRGSLAGS